MRRRVGGDRIEATAAIAAALGVLFLAAGGCGGGTGRGPGAVASGSGDPTGDEAPAEAPPPADKAGEIPAPEPVVPAPPAFAEAPPAEETFASDEDERELARVELPLRGAAGGEASFGKPAPKIEEPSSLRRGSPRELLEEIVAAIEREDAAALARAAVSRAARPRLDEDDVADAERRFLTSQSADYWRRIEGRVRSGAFEEQRDDAAGRAVLRIDVGGAAATHVLRFHEEAGGWYLDG